MIKTKLMLLNSIPILLMIGSIPIVKNDYLLALLYLAIIVISLKIRFEPKDILFLLLGFCVMIVSEYLFISTGVETFKRNSLFGVMPLWLPFLWAYGFVVIKRFVTILSK